MWSGLGYKQNHSINDDEEDDNTETTNLWMQWSIFHYDGKIMDHGFRTNFGSVHVLPLVSMQFLGIRNEVQPVWEILSTTTAYYIWKMLSFSSS